MHIRAWGAKPKLFTASCFLEHQAEAAEGQQKGARRLMDPVRIRCIRCREQRTYFDVAAQPDSDTFKPRRKAKTFCNNPAKSLE